MSIPVQSLSDDVDFPAGVVTEVNELPTQRRYRTLGRTAVSTGSEIDRKAAFDVTGRVRADQFNGMHGGDDRWDQCRIPFLLVMKGDEVGRVAVGHCVQTGDLCDAVDAIKQRYGIWAGLGAAVRLKRVYG
ncbi:hypothetical protein [Pararhizobium sp. DWP1-1-3]|uniref:hypothetical protein n=1 Tax=Pararhizobium sp. DWP1-1-3 TaxID=2804652 RepID=UPI003CF75270